MKEKCIESLCKVAEALGHSPTRREYEQNPYRLVSINTICKTFGSFSQAKKKAGLKYIKQGKPRFTQKELMENLKLVAGDIGHAPTTKEYNKHPLHIMNARTAIHNFGSWLDLCYESGYPFTPASLQWYGHGKSKKHYDAMREMLLDDLYKERIRHPEESTDKIIQKYVKHSIITYYKYIGHISQINKIIEMKYGIRYTKKQRTHWDKKTIEDEFCRLESVLKRTPRSADMEKYSQYKNIVDWIKKIYGNYTNFVLSMGRIPWNNKRTKITLERDKRICINALRKVIKKYDTTSWVSQDYFAACNVTFYRIQSLFHGVKNWFKEAKIPDSKTPQRIKRINKLKLIREEILESIKKIARRLHHIPSIKEYNNSQERLVSIITVYRHVGSWKEIRKMLSETV